MDKWSEHIDNKYGGCDMPFDERFINKLSAEEQEQLVKYAIIEIEDIIQPICDAIMSLIPSMKSAIESVNELTKPFIESYQTCPNKRVVHLALHAKKERVRNKNFRRVFEYYLSHK